MKKFAAAESGIASLGKAGLQRFDLGCSTKYVELVAGGRGELSGKNRRATGRAITPAVWALEKFTPRACKFVDVFGVMSRSSRSSTAMNKTFGRSAASVGQ